MVNPAHTTQEDDPVAEDTSKSNRTAEAFPSEVILKGLGIPTKIAIRHLNFYYGETQALFDNNLDIAEHRVTAIIGPSGCGKSTLLRCYNRMNDFVPGFRLDGKIIYRGNDLYGAHVDSIEVRVRIGMVFQRPNPFPKSIYENVAYGPRILGVNRRSELDGVVEDCLRKAFLWDEVKDSLRKNALELSGGGY
jgi:phosphate transport system ATP-binding protein